MGMGQSLEIAWHSLLRSMHRKAEREFRARPVMPVDPVTDCVFVWMTAGRTPSKLHMPVDPVQDTLEDRLDRLEASLGRIEAALVDLVPRP